MNEKLKYFLINFASYYVIVSLGIWVLSVLFGITGLYLLRVIVALGFAYAKPIWFNKN